MINIFFGNKINKCCCDTTDVYRKVNLELSEISEKLTLKRFYEIENNVSMQEIFFAVEKKIQLYCNERITKKLTEKKIDYPELIPNILCHE